MDDNTVTRLPDPKLRAEYHRDKMKKYREEWGDMGVHSISVMVPDKFKEYFQAMSKLLMAHEAMEIIEERDPDTLEILANRKLRLNLERTDVLLLVEKYKEHGDSKKLMKLNTHSNNLLQMYDLMGMAKARAADAQKNNQSDTLMYWLAREYALAMHIRGSLELFESREKHDELPDTIEF